VESEEPIHEHLAELFSRIEPDCVLDVGANGGQYGEMLRDHGYRGWIVSFEPVRDAFAALCEAADGDHRWRVFQLALGARTERRRIAVASVSQLSSFREFSGYASDELPGASEVTHTEEVDVAALDDRWQELLAGLPQDRLFLKLDTQGWDLEVLSGSQTLLDRLVGIQLEASLQPIYNGSPGFEETIERVRGLGLGLTGVFPVNRDSLLRLIELDCVFINPRHPDAGGWHEQTWTMLEARLRQELRFAIPAGARFVLIDDGTLGIDQIGGRPAIPFLERDGEYYGSPEHGAQAVAELRSQVARGVRHVALAWQSFWWLKEYPELAQELSASWRRIADSDAAVVFELADAGVGE
jgi:FkbM family methyltransferase